MDAQPEPALEHYRTAQDPRYRAPVPLVLDANNILHVTGVLPPELAGPDERGLIALIRGSRWRDERIWMVCDGGRRASSSTHMGAVIHHAGPGSDADTVISELIDLCSHRRTLCVVSSDRSVCARARRRGCRTLSSEAFLETLARDAARGPSRTAAAVPSRARASAPARSGGRDGASGDAPASRGKADAQGAAQVAAWLAYFDLARDASVRLEQDIAQDAERAAAHLARELGIRARAAARRRAQ